MSALVATIVCVCWLGPAADAAQEVDEARAAKVKAAYLYNFVRFTTWPDDAFEDEHSPFVIGVVGEDPFGAVLDHTVAGKIVAGRGITIRRMQPRPPTPAPPPEDGSEPDPPSSTEADADHYAAMAAQLRGCHLLYISRSDEEGFPRILELLQDSPVLTVSDIRPFATEGGIVEFALDLEKGTIGFHINHEAAKLAKLRISSKVLRLATIVESRRATGNSRRSKKGDRAIPS